MVDCSSLLRRHLATWTALAAASMLAACAQLPSAPPAEQAPVAPAPSETRPPPERAPPAPSGDISTGWRERGRISLYGKGFEGKPTASGDPFDPARLTMAHRTLPFGTLVRVTNLENQRSVDVVVNDRGPFVSGRIADLSAAAAQRIGMTVDGVVDAMLEVIKPIQPR